MEQINWEELKKKIHSCDMLLVGIGQEMSEEKLEKGVIDKAQEKLASYLKGLNYFVISSNRDGGLETGLWSQEKTVAPLYREDQAAWERYMQWIGFTLNRRLLVLELGEGFANPSVMRWPFERMVMINQKAQLIRVGQAFPQIPEELKEKGISVPMSAVAFIDQLCGD